MARIERSSSSEASPAERINSGSGRQIAAQARDQVEWPVGDSGTTVPDHALERAHAMSTAMPAVRRLRLGPRSAGMLLTTAEFDRARFREGWRYELINGVLVVSPTPARKERDPNEELGYLLRDLPGRSPSGLVVGFDTARKRRSNASKTAEERTEPSGLGSDVIRKRAKHRRIIAEFVSWGKVNQDRDYVAKRAEYREIGVREYWVIDRFRRTLTVFSFGGESDQVRVIPETQNYETSLAPRFRTSAGAIAEAGRPLGEEAELNSWPHPPCPIRVS